MVVAHLSDADLKKSINDLVSTVDEQTKAMATNFDTQIKRMQESLRSLGTTKIDLGSVTDGGSSKRSASLKQEKKEADGLAMSYDKLLGMLQFAQRQERMYAGKNPYTLTREELDKYAQAIQNVAKYQDLLNKKRAEMTLSNVENRQQFVPNMKEYTDGLVRTSDELKKMSEFYKQLERDSQKASSKLVVGAEEQIKQIQAIQSKKESTKIFERAVAMPVDTFDQAQEKLRVLEALKKKVAGTPLFSKNQTVTLGNEIDKVKMKLSFLYKTTEEGAAQEKKRAAEQQKTVQDRLEQIEKEKVALKERGLVAQQTANAIREAMRDQLQDNMTSGTQQAISGLKDLQQHIRDMQRAYASMSQGEAQSPIGQALKNDIRLAQEALVAVSKYNLSITAGKKTPMESLAKLDSYKLLSQRVSRLTKEYQMLTAAERDSEKGRGIVEKLQLFSRALSEIQKQMNRPVSLEQALGNPENTLDRIAYKMQQLNAYKMGLDLTDPKQVAEMKTVEMEYDRLKKKSDELMGKNQQMISSNNALARSWNYMKNRLAFYFTVGESTAFIKNLIEVRSQYEMNERALGILIDSAERGTQIFNELSQMALVSPYTLIELSNAAKQLTAYDVAAKDVVDTTRRLADVASAVGVPIERLTYALGQIKAYGYLNSRDARMFLNAGIPLVKNLADHYTELEGKMVSVGDVYDRIKKKAVGYNDVMQVITEMTDEGGKFFDFQAKMADTLKVQLANLTLAWNNMLNDIGKSNQGILVGGIKGLKELFLQWNELKRIITDIAVVIGVAKAAQIAINMAMGKGMATIKQSILAYKRKQATMLEYEQLTRKLTADEMALVATRNRVTSADYKQILSSKGVTKANALMMASFQKSNIPLMLAIRRMNLLSAEELRNASVSKGVILAIRGIGVALNGLWATMAAIAPTLLITGAIMGVVEAFQYYSDQAEKTQELNKNIADNAKEASDALKKFIAENKKNIGNMSDEEAEKVWAALRDQIELSSAAASGFVTELLKVENINERLEKGFDYAERIERAANAMAGLDAEALKVSQDSVFGGMFGEGLAEDLEDYIESIQKLRSLGYSGEAKNADRTEAEKELMEFADEAEKILRDRLGEGVNDAVQLKEGLERIKKEVKAANPQIRGEVEKYFDVGLDVIMAEKFKGVYDQTSSLTKMLIERIKRDSGTVLKRLSDDILDTSKELDDDVIHAVEKAFVKLREELPAELQWVLDDLQRYLNEHPLEARYVLVEAGEIDVRDAIQKDFDRHFGLDNTEKPIMPTMPIKADFVVNGWQTDLTAYNKAMEDYNQKMEDYNAKQAKYEEAKAERARVYAEFNKKEGEDRVKWGKRLLDAEKEAQTQATAALHTQQQIVKEKGEEAAKDDARYKQASKDLEDANARANAAREAYNYEHLYNEEKAKSGSQKDPLGDALTKEIQIIGEVQKRYKEYLNMGVDRQTALTLAAKEYNRTLLAQNAVISNAGIKTLTSEQLATMPLQEIRDFYQEQLRGATGSAKAVEALEKALAAINVEITKMDYKKITDGLNNELSKIKDEYELAVELDANPELGDMFANMFGIDVDELPHTFGEAYERISKYVDGYLDDLKVKIEDFDLMSAIIKPDEQNQWMGLDFKGEGVQNLVKWQKTVQDMFKKNLTETEKALDDYVKKYGDYSDRIAEIEADRIEKIKRLNDAYYTEEMRKLPEYIAKLNAIEEGTRREKQSVEFDDFKNSRYYTQMFENLDHVSSVTLRAMRDRLREVIDTMNDLTPEQLKQVMSQYEKIEQKLIKRNPFKNLTKDLKEYIKTSKERKEANKAWADADKEYRAQKKVVATIKEKIKQEQAKGNTSTTNLIYLLEELGVEEKILKKLKEQVDAAEEKAQKYNLIKNLVSEEAEGAIQMVAGNLSSLGEFRDTLNSFGINLGDDLDAIIDDLSQVGEGMNQIVSAAQSGNVVGVASGVVKTVGGLGDSIASIFGGGAAKTKRLNREINKSKESVRQLQMAYKGLERAVDKATGTAETQARREQIANKEAELAELQRQMELEQSKRSKDRDDDTIKQYQEEIQDLKYEIEDLKDELVNNLWGSDVKSAAESFVDTWVEAWRAGETTLDAMNEKMDEMIYNLIKKAMTSKIVQALLQPLYDDIDKMTSEDSEGGVELTTNELAQLAQKAGTTAEDINTALGKFYGNLESLDIVSKAQAESKELSALQQGLQSMSESTATALEAYMNGVSQQVYLQSDILTQIRDTVVGFDIDVQTATQAQMLLQLQQSYAVQMAIQSILLGWSTPSGMAVRVEMQ